MPLYGVQATTFAQGWSRPAALRAVESAAHLGFDALEIPLFTTYDIDAAALRAAAQKAHITLLGRTALPRGCSVVRHAERARAFLGQVLRTAEALGVASLSGAFLYAPGDMETSVGPGDGALLVDVLADLADEAEARSIVLALEPAHRFESRIVNTVAQTQTLVNAVRSASLRLGLSTLQLHIGEPSLAAAVHRAGALLHSVRAVENTGGPIGSGAVQWDVLWRALLEMKFDGLLILEAPRSFPDTTLGVSTTQMSRMAAEMDLYPEEFAAQGLAYMQEGITGRPPPSAPPRRRAAKQAAAENKNDIDVDAAPASPPPPAQGKGPKSPARAPKLGGKSYRSG